LKRAKDSLLNRKSSSFHLTLQYPIIISFFFWYKSYYYFISINTFEQLST
jgi:hypothetical protein